MRIPTLLGLSALAFSVGTVFACIGDNPPPVTEVSCTSYCNKIMAKCLQNDTDTTRATMDNLVYKTQETCMDMCAFFDVGTIGDQADTLGCRLTQLSNVDDPHSLSERHAICLSSAAFSTSCGPSTLCDHFCKLDPLVCGPLFPYTDNNDCMTKCQTYPEANGFLPGPFVNSTGNNLRCRAYHMENAVIDQASHTTHCPHTGVLSAVCFDP